MIFRWTFLWVVCLSFATTSFGQNMSWRKHIKAGDELFSKAQYIDAAFHYEQAWRQKTKQKELIFKAAECYHIVRDYSNAARCFSNVKNEVSLDPMIGLRYARSLKQAGMYDEAGRELAYFLSAYKGSDKEVVTKIVENEIKGCDLAKAYKNDPMAGSGVLIDHLSTTINTPETEFAPIPFSDDLFYYSSTMAARAEIYRTQKVDGKWTSAAIPDGFPRIEKDHFCNGTFTPDYSRFYFTVCQSIESWGGLTTKCQIHVIKRTGSSWTAPEKLRDYINANNATTTHPYVVHVDDTEILYFSSNREGGLGGMDIWYATRDVKSSDIDFTFPVNAGSKINSVGDEITPFYDLQEGNLYFASNGHVGLGGYDTFKSKGAKAFWGNVSNVGVPFNSSSDDFFFVHTPSHKGGFFVSNRIYGMSKISTTHEDIFGFTYLDSKQFPLVGTVMDASKNAMTNVSVALYEMDKEQNRSLVSNKVFADGNFSFAVKGDRHYVVEAQKDGFLPGAITFHTQDYASKEKYEKYIYMQPYGLDATESLVNVSPSTPTVVKETVPMKPAQKVVEKPIEKPATAPTLVMQDKPKKTPKKVEEAVEIAPTPPKVIAEKTAPIKEAKTEITQNQPSMREEMVVHTPAIAITEATVMESVTENISTPSTVTKAPVIEKTRENTPKTTLQGTHYKVQLMAVGKWNDNDPMVSKVSDKGTVVTESIPDKGLTRVMLEGYENYDAAKRALTLVQNSGFPKAYLVKYENGERLGMTK